MAVTSLAWALLLVPRVIGSASVTETFASMQMQNITVEEAREMGGLLIVAAWMVVLAVTSAWQEAGAQGLSHPRKHQK